MEYILLLAAAAAEREASGFLRYLPLAVMMVLFLWLMINYARALRRSKPLHDRSLAHMDRIEAKTDEMIALLKEIRDKLGDA